MERVGRIELAARVARRHRVAASMVGSVVAAALGFWHATAGVGFAVLVALALFVWLPVIEASVRNFREGYREPS